MPCRRRERTIARTVISSYMKDSIGRAQKADAANGEPSPNLEI
jgi:hypothetical protein